MASYDLAIGVMSTSSRMTLRQAFMAMASGEEALARELVNLSKYEELFDSAFGTDTKKREMQDAMIRDVLRSGLGDYLLGTDCETFGTQAKSEFVSRLQLAAAFLEIAEDKSIKTARQFAIALANILRRGEFRA